MKILVCKICGEEFEKEGRGRYEESRG